MALENKLYCPLVDKDIIDEQCLVVSDCANRMIKESFIEDCFKEKENWRNICMNCPYNED